jgi:hypothetical protein
VKSWQLDGVAAATVAATSAAQRWGPAAMALCSTMGKLTGLSHPGDLNEFKTLNFIPTWFAPKMTFPSSKNLDKNTR